jgi:hypothetical protein
MGSDNPEITRLQVKANELEALRAATPRHEKEKRKEMTAVIRRLWVDIDRLRSVDLHARIRARKD